MNMKKTVLYSTLLATGSFAANVQAESETHDIDTIEITATRSSTADTVQTRHVEQVSQEQLDQQQAVSVPQTVNYLPNVTLHGGPREDVQDVNIRGLEGNRVLQLVDGVRQNFVSGHRRRISWIQPY